MNTDLGEIHLWGKLWRVTFNALKSISLLFSCKRKKRDHPIMYLGDTPIPEAHQHTHLGITLSSNLSWHAHITRIISKCNQRLGLLHRLKYKLSPVIQVYFRMFTPHGKEAHDMIL